MKVVDIRNTVTDSSVELIEITESTVYYAEEKNEEGHHSLFLLEYDRAAKTERILANCFLSDPSLVLHFFPFHNDILAVMESGESFAWILRVDKRTGQEKNLEQIYFIGDFMDCLALDESRIIFYTGENEQHRRLFQEYKGLTGFNRVAYVYDLDESAYYYVRDGRICSLLAEQLVTFDLHGQPQLLAMQTYGSQEEKRRCYENRKWLGCEINDDVWLCPLIDFLVAVKSAESHLPLELLLGAGIDGLVRYFGMDNEKLYFIAEQFPLNDRRICIVEKGTGKKYPVAPITPDTPESRLFFDKGTGKAYRITEEKDSYELEGILGSNLKAVYGKELGEFVSCIEDRFLVIRYLLEDDKDRFLFHTLYDLKTGRQQSYECRCAVKNDTVVLY